MAWKTPGLHRTWQQVAAAVILVLCSLVYAVRGYHDQTLTLQSLDFKTVYGGARCLLEGCDPYDSAQIQNAFHRAGGPDDDDRPFRPHEPIYLPSALALLTPFALLPWRAADLLWLTVSTGAFLLGAGLIASLCLRMAPLTTALAMGLLILTSTTLIMLGQPAQLTIGLCAIGSWCVLEGRWKWAGVVCFAISLAIKPHVTGWIWLYFILCAGEFRRQAIKILLVTVAVCLPGLVWASLMPASAHWMQEIPANVAGITAHGLPGDPGPANGEAPSIAGLQTVISLFRDEPAFYNRLAGAIGAVFLGMWLVPVRVLPASRERHYLALAAVACISLLPVYHREYDTRILLLMFPAFAMLMKDGGRWLKGATLVLTFITLVLITHNFNNCVSGHVAQPAGGFSLAQTIFWLRPVALWTTVLSLFFLVVMYGALLRGASAADVG